MALSLRARAAGVAALAAALVVAAPAAACTGDGDVPPPPETAEGGPAPLEAVDAYVTAVDRASPRVTSGTAGHSASGRAIRFALVTTLPAARARAALARLRARRPRAGDPVVVWITGGVHGNEPSGTDADLTLLHDLAASGACATLARLRRVVLVLVPVQNPDGRVAGTRANDAGFDLNRDGFALSQPETRARLALLRRLPPVVLADQHEQGGALSFFPPYSEPVHHEVPAQALEATTALLGPDLRRAFRRAALPFTRERPYDLFFPGYADAATTLLFGTAGMTIEAGVAAPFAARVEAHLTAARAVLATAATHRARLLRGWVAAGRAAAAQGARGALQPGPRVPGTRVYAHALRADRHAADAAALAARLREAGARVLRLRRAARVVLDPYDGGTARRRATLPAGTYVVPLAQPAKHWIQAVLGEDAHVPRAGSSDASAWSAPLLAGLEGGAVGTPLQRAWLERLPPPAAAAAPQPAGDSVRGLAAAIALLRAGAPVARVPGDGAVHRGAAAPPATVALRAPRVALLTDAGASTAVAPGAPLPTASTAWARHVLGARLGLDVLEAGEGDLAGGALARPGVTHLVVPDGAPARLHPTALDALRAWVQAGGTYVGWRTRGVAVAEAAAVTSARARPTPPGLHVAGAALAVDLEPGSPLAWGLGRRLAVLDAGAALLDPGGATVAGRHPRGTALTASGLTFSTGALQGAPAVLDERRGAGRTILLTFDPAHRAYAEAGERLLANALLYPA